MLNDYAPNFEVNVRVLCGQGTPSQVQIMRQMMPLSQVRQFTNATAIITSGITSIHQQLMLQR